MQNTPGTPAPHTPAAERIRPEGIKSPRLVRLMGPAVRMAENDEPDELTPRDLAQIDSDFAAERRRQEADSHYNHLKNTGELDRRRIERAGPSPFEREYMRDHQR